ncbi:hypothetical protein AB3M93_20715 [Novosphingobium panipatense]|jgi:hypothetical protein|uniref:hypothetical protein n=1 Tax=Novosphingobium panipatense TaxID=428991 RepID=UPI0039A05629
MARGQTLPQELRRRGDIDQQAIATDLLRDRPREEENVGRDGQPMISLGSVLQRQGGAIGLPIVSAVAVQRLMSFTDELYKRPVRFNRLPHRVRKAQDRTGTCCLGCCNIRWRYADEHTF